MCPDGIGQCAHNTNIVVGSTDNMRERERERYLTSYKFHISNPIETWIDNLWVVNIHCQFTRPLRPCKVSVLVMDTLLL